MCEDNLKYNKHRQKPKLKIAIFTAKGALLSVLTELIKKKKSWKKAKYVHPQDVPY